MSKTIECPAGQRIDFPQRCLRCGAAPTATWPCVAKRGVELILVQTGRTQEFAIPVCTQCWVIRRSLGSLAMILLSVTLLVAVGLMLPWLNSEDLTGLWFGLLFLAAVALVYYRSNHHARLADWLFLRVRAPRIRPDDTVELWIADDSLASAVRVTGSASLETFETSPQIIFPVHEIVEPSNIDAASRYSLVDRLARHPVLGPRIVPISTILMSLASLSANHWYALTEQRYYPAVLYVMGPVLLMGLGGLLNPSIFFEPKSKYDYTLSRRRARVILILLGFGLAVFLHGWLYQFSMKSTTPLPPRRDRAARTPRIIDPDLLCLGEIALQAFWFCLSQDFLNSFPIGRGQMLEIFALILAGQHPL